MGWMLGPIGRKLVGIEPKQIVVMEWRVCVGSDLPGSWRGRIGLIVEWKYRLLIQMRNGTRRYAASSEGTSLPIECTRCSAQK